MASRLLRSGFISALMLLPLAARAGGPDAADQAADACQPDIHRLCEKFFPDEKLIATCLVDRRAELSQACAGVLANPDPADDDFEN